MRERDLEERLHAANSEDPMDPEVQVQGVGVYSLKGLERNVASKFKDLAEMAQKGDWDNIDYHLNQAGVMNVMLKAIVDTYKDLEKIRRRGGKNSRGIEKR